MTVIIIVVMSIGISRRFSIAIIAGTIATVSFRRSVE
jgi:C4-dicarboxylate transporter